VGEEAELQAFLTSALSGGEQSASCFRSFTPVETAIGTCWMNPRVAYALEKR
jgi:hypothetical protein